MVFPFRISEGHSNSAQCITSGHFALLSDDSLGMFIEIQKIYIFWKFDLKYHENQWWAACLFFSPEGRADSYKVRKGPQFG